MLLREVCHGGSSRRSLPMALFAVMYRYAPNSDAGRDELRPKHMEFLQSLFDSEKLVVSGPTDASGPNPGALLIIAGESAAAVDELMAQDPFAVAGYVDRTITPWDPKFGAARLA